MMQDGGKHAVSMHCLFVSSFIDRAAFGVIKDVPTDTYAATSLSMTLNLDVKQFPRRRTSPYTARYTTSTTEYPRYLTSLKLAYFLSALALWLRFLFCFLAM